MSDEGTPRYLGGFRQAVRRLLGPKENGWSSAHYTDEAAIEQALRKAYWEGRFDGVDSVLGHPAAPGPVGAAEEPQETREGAWASLGLFEAPGEPPGLLSEALATRPDLPSIGDTDPRVWSVRHARAVLTLSLTEGTDYVKGLLDD